ncbi:hypothetical protein [Sporolactobacillus spathodeae]|uniref:Spore coat protein n=1 Tax=Sporolactobacillus spathodeae TaxID=1465502 RepID=A0ABS2Q583_9BACL|nr:hypothetical protein [Sporolactobacillus spathodeae]MBM7656595.1 hypothetical protein [Sporolactobacillus spathodeae]
MQQQGGQMPIVSPQPPDILTNKDLLYIQDMLSWNLDAIKKAHHFASVCQDRDVIQAMNRVCQLHIRHYQSILDHLGKHAQTVNQSGGVVS